MAEDGAYERLQDDLCVGHGFCGCVIDGKPSHVDCYIPASGPVTADQFVEWVFAAEDYVPSRNSPEQVARFSQNIRSMFIKHMGAEVVDASRLKWSK